MVTIIGNGRVAGHFAHYFNLLGLPYQRWARPRSVSTPDSGSETDSLSRAISASSHVLILITDSAIEEFIATYHDVFAGKTLVHFSGCLFTPLAYGAHPLMAFTEAFLTLTDYERIPFIVEADRLPFKKILPGLKNPHYYIPSKLKPYYHSLCVMSGNFSTLLWDKLFTELNKKFGIPDEAAFPYLEQVCENLKNRGIPALTGPLARNDCTTIKNNLQALEKDPFREVYAGFLRALGFEKILEEINK